MLASIRTLSILASLVFVTALCAQTFIRISDPLNQAAVAPGTQGYRGCAWIDYDNDGDDDLWVNRNLLYRNDGNGVFVNTQSGFVAQTGLGSGCSWADYDNDGDLDLYLSDSPNCVLYRNDGNDVFTAIDDGDIGFTANDLRGWSCAWGDYDSDGNVDLIITHPGGFLGNPPLTNLMFRNDGPPNYSFTRVTAGDVVTGLGAYTVGSFADFDLDGDLDYNIGAGPVSVPGLDYFYRNTLVETGIANLNFWTGNPVTDQARDGQNINWIDYDNDGDLDCYITNYQGGVSVGRPNDFYRNDGGSYVRINTGAIATDQQVSLANCWADFDNDGFLDCVVANESGTNKYYHNLANGFFESLTTPFTVAGAFRCPVTADYDNDGDLDLFITAVGAAQGFFQNTTENENNWLKLKLEGTMSNRAAIGAVVRVKAFFAGQTFWQIREVNTQNSFNGHNSLIVHFGLAEADIVDSLEIRWPRGLVETFTNVAVNQLHNITEGGASSALEPVILPTAYNLSAFPNPFNGDTQIRYQLKSGQSAQVNIYDINGRLVETFSNLKTSGVLQFNAASLATGTYIARLQNDRQETLSEPLKLLYIR